MNTHMYEGHVATEAEIGMIYQQAEEVQGLIAATRNQEQARKDSSLEPPGEARPS